MVGALERTSTFVTNYAIHPFVGLLKGPIHGAPRSSRSTSCSSRRCARFARERHAHRIERRGIAFETDAYVFDGQLVWGATARILEDLLARVGPLPPASTAIASRYATFQQRR